MSINELLLRKQSDTDLENKDEKIVHIYLYTEITKGMRHLSLKSLFKVYYHLGSLWPADCYCSHGAR